MIRPNWFDRIIYRLFFWRWNRILANRPDLLKEFEGAIMQWKVKQN